MFWLGFELHWNPDVWIYLCCAAPELLEGGGSQGRGYDSKLADGVPHCKVAVSMHCGNVPSMHKHIGLRMLSREVSSLCNVLHAVLPFIIHGAGMVFLTDVLRCSMEQRSDALHHAVLYISGAHH